MGYEKDGYTKSRRRRGIGRMEDGNRIRQKKHHGRNQILTDLLPTPVDFLVNMSASADVLAMAKVEFDLSTIPEGKNVHFTTPPH